jgi:hypothetical protein
LGCLKAQSPERGGISEVSVAHGVPAVTVSTTTREITAYGGSLLLRETARVVGLAEAIDRHLHLKSRQRGLSEAQFVCAVGEAIGLGAVCLDDLAVARSDVAQETTRGFAVPAPQTTGTWLRRFTLGHIAQFDKALREVVHNAFTLSGADEVTLDFDSSYISSRSTRRQGVDRTYKKGYALHPMFCFEPSSGACVHARLRRGKAHTAKGMKAFVAETLRRIPDGAAVRARMDSGFYSNRLFTQLEDARVTYLCGVPLNDAIRARCQGLSDDAFTPCIDDSDGEVAEFDHLMHEASQPRRFICKRIARRPGEQLTLHDGAYHYFVSVTNDTRASAVVLESEHRHKAQVEGGVRELKENFGLHALRNHGFMANWAWLLLVCLGHNLCCWTQSLGRLEAGRDGRDLRAKRFRYRYLVVPALVVRTGRRVLLKLRADYPLFRRFLAALERLRTLPAPAG